MVAGKVKQAMGLTSKPEKPKSKSKSKPNSFGSYFPRSSAQVQPRPPDISVSDLLNLVKELRDHESSLKTELVELKLLHEMQIDRLQFRVAELEAENEKLANERDVMKVEVEEVKAAQRFQGLVEVANKSMLIKNLYSRKLPSGNNNINDDVTCGDNLEAFASNCRSNKNAVKYRDNLEAFAKNCQSNKNGVKYRDNLEAFASNCRSYAGDEAREDVSESSLLRCRVPRVPKPPPKSTTCVSLCSPSPQPRVVKSAPLPPPPPPSTHKSTLISPPPPPPPPVPTNVAKFKTSKVKRVPEVVEFYHSLMRRDSRKESGVVTTETTTITTTTCAKDLVGEIENRSAYLLAIKTDVETQGDFIRFLIKEVETAAFTDIEDVVSFVKWLDDELSYLVDERAVLKHFNWPEQKADALREAAFEYSDLKKLESEASSFRHDARQACSTTLKKMQTLLEKLEHGAYNLSRLRESATNRFKSSHIPVDWMLDSGFVSQIKLASIKLAMKYMKRVLAELEIVAGGPEEEELIVQGVRFAFRVHQFAGGFDVETMTAFEELRDKARSYHVQCQNQQQERLACRSMPG